MQRGRRWKIRMTQTTNHQSAAATAIRNADSRVNTPFRQARGMTVHGMRTRTRQKSATRLYATCDVRCASSCRCNICGTTRDVIDPESAARARRDPVDRLHSTTPWSGYMLHTRGEPGAANITGGGTRSSRYLNGGRDAREVWKVGGEWESANSAYGN